MFNKKVTSISLTSETVEKQLKIDVMSQAVLYSKPYTSAAILEDITGVESIKSSPLGGQVAYGGANYTGVSQQDREVVMTLRPNTLTIAEIKNELNSLIGLSTLKPLTCRFDVTGPDYPAGFHYKGECYITEVSAPLLSEDDKIVVTLRFPKPYFEATYQNVNDLYNIVDDDPIGYFGYRYSYMMKPSRVVHPPRPEETKIYQERLNKLLSYVNAPSPFVITIGVRRDVCHELAYLSLYDNNDNEFTIHSINGMGYKNMPSNHNYLYFTIDTFAKKHALHSGNGSAFTNNYKSVSYCYPNWPAIYPGATEFDIRLGFRTDIANRFDKLNVITVDNFDVVPRVFGL